jgi:hypothetical protein
MHRFRTPELFLGCFLTVAVFAAGMLFVNWPQPQQITQAHPADKAAAASAQKEEQKFFWQKVTADPVAAFTLCLVVIAGAQAAFFIVQLTYMRTGMDDAREVAKAAVISANAAEEAADTAKIQAEVARDTLKTMQDTAERQLRAYVFVESAQIVNVLDGSGSPEAHVVIKNYGQTPAYELVSGFAMDQYPSPPTLNLSVDDADFGIGGKTAMALGPGCESFSITPSKKPSVPPEIRNEIINGTWIAYVYGEIRYKDVFGNRQTTEYRLMTGGPVGVRGSQLVGCDEGNKAT